MTDRSLDEFVPGSDQEADDEPADAATEQSVDTTPDPTTATATVSPGGASCEDCGETVTRRWRDDGAYVCGDCKEW
ncbi:hypothetical protein GRX03_10405 [Halovenus sp. WSH3]|uniref:DUF7573 domain-containing protein n=1 Tax=Halovenus carboxidivorans TaxID=2692199 RepID=A0A6B0T1C7_9EURY|nr:hypothetical protein [Halovenus carboxidivorans]MXR52008.1 hypothetical protein [Halovenus carboxidivorans]